MLLLLLATGLTDAVQLSENGDALHPHGLESSVGSPDRLELPEACDGDTCEIPGTTATPTAAIPASFLGEGEELAERERSGMYPVVPCIGRPGSDDEKMQSCSEHCVSINEEPCIKNSESKQRKTICSGCVPPEVVERRPPVPQVEAGKLFGVEESEQYIEAVQPPRSELNVLSYNLCFECMTRTLAPSGGKHAYMCEAEGSKEEGQTACSRRMFKKITEWTMSYQFGVIALNELCHPGPEGNEWLAAMKDNGFGKFSDVAPKQDYCSVKMYEDFLAPFEGLYYIFVSSLDFRLTFGNKDPASITQMTLVRKDLFKGRLSYEEVNKKFDFVSLAVKQGDPTDQDRPMSVIKAGTAEAPLVIMNMHAPHFRRQILGQGPSANKYTFNGDKEGGGNSKRPAISKKLGKKLTLGTQYTAEGFAKGELANAFAKHAVDTYTGEKAKNWDIFTKGAKTTPAVLVVGDFNDETGELRNLQFGALPPVKAADNVYRSCCSDRDLYWLIPHDALGGAKMSRVPSRDEIEHLQTDGIDTSLEKLYLNQLKGYVGDDLDAARKIPLPKQGAPREIYDLPYMDRMKSVSQYPFASDLIMSSGTIVNFGPPKDYKQDLFSPMSDHDPIIAKVVDPIIDKLISR